MKKWFWWVLLLEALVCVAVVVGRALIPVAFTSLVAFPLEQIGYGLRVLSLSGRDGNVAAIALYAAVSLLPLAFLVRKKLHWEDLLAVLLCGFLFFGLYCMINPGLLSQWTGNLLGEPFEKAILGTFFYTVLVGYGVLRLVRSFFAAQQERLTAYLQILLGGLSLVLVYAIFGSGLRNLLDSLDALREANTGNEHLLGTTYVFYVLKYLVDLLPYGLDLVIVHGISHLLRQERHSEEAALAGERVAKFCGISLVIMVLSNMLYQLLQLVCAKHLTQTSSTIQLPLFSLLFVLAVLLVSKLLAENRELKEDNDLFI